MTLRKTQFGGRVHWGKAFDVNTRHLASKEVIHLSPNPFKKKHYVKYNYKTVLLAQCRGQNFQQLQKALSFFCLTWILLVCEVMRKMEHLVFFRITHRQEVMDLAMFVDTAWHSNSTDCTGFKFSWACSTDLDSASGLLASISYGKF